jgi:hypothetical protein
MTTIELTPVELVTQMRDAADKARKDWLENKMPKSDASFPMLTKVTWGRDRREKAGANL